MKKKLWTILLFMISVLCLAFGLAACGGNGGNGGNGGDSSDLWTVERLYAEAQAKGFEGSLDDLIALFKGDKGERGVGIKSVEVDEEGHLKVTLTDGTVLDAGKITADEPAEEGTEGLLYQKVKGEDGEYTVMVTGLGNAWDTDIVIPSTYRGLKVTAIGQEAFTPQNYGAPESNLTSVIIPDTVVSIGEYAFESCNLKSVKLGRGVTLIGDSAFRYCSGLTSITIPDSVTSIGASAFSDCYKLVEVWNYSDLTIVKGETTNGNVAEHAKYVYTTDEKTKQTTTDDGFLFYEDEEASYLLGYDGGKAELTLPQKSPSGRDYEIYQYAFCYCSGLKSIEIPNGVTSIGGSAFYYCEGLTSVTIGSGVTSIGEDAFRDCSGLTSVIIGDSVESIGERAFDGCRGLTNVTIGSGVKSIGGYAFSSCSGLTGVYITDLTAWCRIDFADYGSNPLYSAHHIYVNNVELKELTIPNEITEIKAYAFEYCSGLTSVTIGSGVKSIGGYAFYGCSELTSVIIGDSVESIGEGAFYNCSELTSVIIGDSVESIGEGAFYNCSELTSVTIGKGVKSIGSYAFYNCHSLENVIFMNPNGWACYDSYEDPSTPIKTFTPEELSDPFSAAQALLRSTKWDWKRS